MYSHKCPILASTLSNHLPITPCLPGNRSGSCPGYWFTQRPWLGFQPRVRGIPMRRPPIAPNSLWSSCQATGFYVVHVVGWGACRTNATKKAHAYVHVDRDRHTHMHLFLSHLLSVLLLFVSWKEFCMQLFPHLDSHTMKVSACLPWSHHHSFYFGLILSAWKFT